MYIKRKIGFIIRIDHKNRQRNEASSDFSIRRLGLQSRCHQDGPVGKGAIAKPDNPSLIPVTHVVEEENKHPHAVLRPPPASECHGTHPAHTQM